MRSFWHKISLFGIQIFWRNHLMRIITPPGTHHGTVIGVLPVFIQVDDTKRRVI
jgi:hypothetical protein